MRVIIAFYLFLFTILALRFIFYYDSRPLFKSGEDVRLSTTILEEPRVSYGSQTFMIDNIRVYIPEYPKLHYGERVVLSGRIETQEYVSKSNGKLIRQLVIKNPDIKVEADSRFRLISALRGRVIRNIEAVLPKDEGGLLLGIVLGLRSNLDRDFSEALKSVGVLHVVVASGANISMIGGFLLAVLNPIVKRKIALVFTIGIIWFYAVIAGFDAPIVRASIMASIAYLAGLTGKQNYTVLSLVLSASVMLFMSPKLISDIGFQLSFLSTFGIVVIKPLLDKLIVTNRVTFLKEDLTTTLSAQIATLPIMLSIFSFYSPVSVIVNLLILWMIPILMILGGVAVILSVIWYGLALPLLYLSYPFLLTFKLIVMVAAPLANAIAISNIPGFIVAGIYFFSSALYLYISKVIYLKHEKDQ